MTQMKKISLNEVKKYTLLLCVLWFGSIHVSATNVSGLISTNTVWTLANSPYIVTGNILVNTGVALTIQPGVIVKFNSGLSIQIDGTLLAQGTIIDSITFTSNTTQAAGAWGYIYFSNTSTDAVYENNIYGNYLSGSILEYCIIQYAGGASVSDNGALRLDAANPFINYCTISDNNATGINGYNLTESLKISNSVISSNKSSDYGGGICISSTGSTLISGNTISKNNTSSYGGGICNMYWTAIISNNTISENTADMGGGIASGMGGISSSPITNNIIMNNIANNDGGGMYIYNGTSIISDNIIINNGAYRAGGIFAYGGSDAAISENVISDNSAIGPGGIWSASGTGQGQAILNNHIIRNTAYGDAGITSDNIADIKLNTIAYNKNTNFNNNLNRSIDITGNPDFNNNNIFNNSAFYEMYNDNAQGTTNVAATNNWWGTTNDGDIQAKIYDWIDDGTLGIVNYSPYLTTPDTIAPVSPPANVTKTNIGGGQVKITWNHNPELDIAGYHVYYGGFNGYSFTDSVNAGNDTSYILTDVSITDTIGVTAYDSTYSLDNEYDSTIVNDNVVNGNESWYTYAEPVCNSLILTMSSVDASCPTCNDGTATAGISGGLIPYTYSWNTNPVQDSSVAINLLPGTYTVTITDDNGCVLTDSIEVLFTTSIDGKNDLSLINFYPNPANDIITIYINENSNTSFILNIYNVMGLLVRTEMFVQNQLQINIRDLSNGIYMVEIKSEDWTEKQKLIIQR